MLLNDYCLFAYALAQALENGRALLYASVSATCVTACAKERMAEANFEEQLEIVDREYREGRCEHALFSTYIYTSVFSIQEN